MTELFLVLRLVAARGFTLDHSGFQGLPSTLGFHVDSLHRNLPWPEVAHVVASTFQDRAPDVAFFRISGCLAGNGC